MTLPPDCREAQTFAASAENVALVNPGSPSILLYHDHITDGDGRPRLKLLQTNLYAFEE